MLRYSLALIAMVLAGRCADANDLKEPYELALTRDATLQAAASSATRRSRRSLRRARCGCRRCRPRHRPRESAWATRTMRAAHPSGAKLPLSRSPPPPACSIATVRSTLWGSPCRRPSGVTRPSAGSRKPASRPRRPNNRALGAAAEPPAAARGAEPTSAILAARRTNWPRTLAEREAFRHRCCIQACQVREQTGVGPRSDVAAGARRSTDADREEVIDARNALDDAQPGADWRSSARTPMC